MGTDARAEPGEQVAERAPTPRVGNEGTGSLRRHEQICTLEDLREREWSLRCRARLRGSGSVGRATRLRIAAVHLSSADAPPTEFTHHRARIVARRYRPLCVKKTVPMGGRLGGIFACRVRSHNGRRARSPAVRIWTTAGKPLRPGVRPWLREPRISQRMGQHLNIFWGNSRSIRSLNIILSTHHP